MADHAFDSEGNMTFLDSPDMLHIYLPGGEVHNLKGVSRVAVLSNGVLKFTDREGKLCFSTNRFTIVFNPSTKEPANA